jgi:hypothetical protein
LELLVTSVAMGKPYRALITGSQTPRFGIRR